MLLIRENILIDTAHHFYACRKNKGSYEPKGFFTPGNTILHGQKCNFIMITFNSELYYFPKPTRKHDPDEMTVKEGMQLTKKEYLNSGYWFLTTRLAQRAHKR